MKKFDITPVDEGELTESELVEVSNIESVVDEENVKKFPSRFNMARSFAIQSWKEIKSRVKLKNAPQSIDESNRRWEICKTCPFLVFDETNPDTGKKDGRCIHCGCFMAIKVHYITAECPEEKWDGKENENK